MYAPPPTFHPPSGCEMVKTCFDHGDCIGHCISTVEGEVHAPLSTCASEASASSLDGWSLDRTDYFVRLINSFGQYAEGYSDKSYQEAYVRAIEDATHRKPPTYSRKPKQLSIDDMI